MSTTVLDERDQRRVSVRAQAAAIADAPRPLRRFTTAPGTALRPSPRRRSRVRARVRVPSQPKRRLRAPRRLIALAVLGLQVALLVLALTLPVFKVRTVAVTGSRLLSVQAVLGAAAVPQQSIFTVDADVIRARVLTLPWVEDATVSTDLPGTVRISVVERTPAVRLRFGGRDAFVASNGAAFPATPAMQALWSSTPVLIDDRVGVTPALDPSLLNILSLAARRFPAVFGCSVAAYVWSSDDVLSIWTNTGWRAILGHVDTADGLAQVPAQLAALGDLRGQLKFSAPTFGYVDLENPAGPAVGGRPGLPAEVRAAGAPLPAAAAHAAGAGAYVMPSQAPFALLPQRRRAAIVLQPVGA